MTKSAIWLRTGMVIIYGSSLDAAPHSHQAIQVIWPKHGAWCQLNGKAVSQLQIIDAKVEHQLQMDEGCILLVEPKSLLGEVLSTKLAGLPIQSFALWLEADAQPPTRIEALPCFLSPLLQALDLTQPFELINQSTVTDPRIERLLSLLNQCLDGDCIKPVNWRAAQVAEQLALSESRFLHLFVEQMGIAWRPYLLWQRMICAVHAMLNNHNATAAAHLAGFSDSAHLSRTFKKTFGMTIRQAMARLTKG